MEFDFVEAMLVQLVLHMQGFLNVHVLQHLQNIPKQECYSFDADTSFISCSSSAFHRKPELHKANWQTFLEALLLGKKTVPNCTFWLKLFPTTNSNNTGRTASPPTNSFTRDYPSSGDHQLPFTDHAHGAGQYSSTQLSLNVILAAFNSQE